MSKKRSSPPPLSPDIIAKFKEVVEAVLKVDAAQDDERDFDGSTELLNQLYYSVSDEDFLRFARIISDADDPDFRCPK